MGPQSCSTAGSSKTTARRKHLAPTTGKTPAKDLTLEEALKEVTTKDPPLDPVVGEELLTWGVEIELVFAFKETLLQKTIDEPDTKDLPIPYEIVKDIPKADRRWDASKVPPYQLTKIPNDELPNHAYNSWGLIRKDDAEKRVIRYTYQPRLMLRDKIRRHTKGLKNVGINSVAKMSEEQKKNTVYHSWNVSDESTVPGVGSHKLHKWLPKEKFDLKDTEENGNWDTFGLELISPVFDSDNSERAGGRDAISAILKAVNTEEEDTHSFITNQCGLHVHIGDPEGFSLQDLQVLAAILLLYEEELSKLHPPVRRPKHRVSRNNIESNRYGSRLENDRTWIDNFNGPNYQTAKRALQQQDFSTSAYKYNFPRFHHIMTWTKSKHTIQDLVQAFNWPPAAGPNDTNQKVNGNPRRQVNFTPLLKEGEDFPKTIEFRGARGTLDDQEVFHFVDLCLGLVRLAKYYSANNMKGFPAAAFESFLDAEVEWVRTRVCAFDLLQLMGTSEEGIKFWEGQKAKWEIVGSMSRVQRRGHEDERSDLETTDGEDGNGSDRESPPPPPKKSGRKRGNVGDEDLGTPSKKRFRRDGPLPSPSNMEEASFSRGNWRPTTHVAGRTPRVQRTLFDNYVGGGVDRLTAASADNPFGGEPAVPGMQISHQIRRVAGSSISVGGQIHSLTPRLGLPRTSGLLGATRTPSPPVKKAIQGNGSAPSRGDNGITHPKTPEIHSDDDAGDFFRAIETPCRPSRQRNPTLASETASQASKHPRGILKNTKPATSTAKPGRSILKTRKSSKTVTKPAPKGQPFTPANKVMKYTHFEDDDSDSVVGK